jgi:ATP-dependent helicase/nuclease subunit B
VDALARASELHPLARKLVVAPTRSAGRELLRRLSVAGTGWIGFEVTTLRPLALVLARPAMERAGLGVADTFELRALIDEAVDAALASEDARYGALADGVGFRDAVRGSIEALRLAGVAPEDLRRAPLRDEAKKRFLWRVLEHYQRLLATRRRVDTADVLRMAVDQLEAEGSGLSPALGAEVVWLVPGLGTRGLAGRLLTSLSERGARTLETDPVAGLEPPSKVLWSAAERAERGSFLFAPAKAPRDGEGLEIEFFRAASVQAELREVLRRVVERGLRWDEVELVTPDPGRYGSALHAEAARLEIPVTFAVGLPIERTRVGRVVCTYLGWIEEGFQADPIRRLLEAGDLRPPKGRGLHAPAVLARRFRALRIGWGRRRYRSQIREALAGVDMLARGRHESQAEFVERKERIRSELVALRSILYPALRATPTVPDRLGMQGGRVAPAEIARGLRAFLRRVPRGRGPERAAREAVERVLERVEATQVRPTNFPSAVAALRAHLDLRVRVDASADPDGHASPWPSEGGRLHLTDLEHGGFSGRKAVFLVGFDAERVPGFVASDPLLSDADRRRLGENLPTSGELHRERLFRLAALFARLRGTVTLSYTAWEAAEARTAAPSPLLLQALRLARGDPSLTFRDLEAELGLPVSAVPRAGRPPLDGDDVWMEELGRPGVLLDGLRAVEEGFPRLGAGLAAHRAAAGKRPGPHRGVVEPRPEDLDPRRNPSLVVSASSLEALGTCPLRYLHGTVLGARPPDDPELDPERWLDPRRRGALLHAVYRGVLASAEEAGVPRDVPELEEAALAELARQLERMRQETPIPGEGALARETASLEADVRSFLRLIRRDGPRWLALEHSFGFGDDPPVTIGTPGGEVRLRGAIDRIDEAPAGLHVIDYKTGAPRDFAGTGAFHGGRRLQHALYAHVAEQRFGRPVVSAGYHYPTTRGENRVEMFDRLRLASVGELVGHLLDGVAAGHFVPTNEADDCSYCDYATVCRVRRGAYGKVESPLAAWCEERLHTDAAFSELERARTFEG